MQFKIVFCKDSNQQEERIILEGKRNKVRQLQMGEVKSGDREVFKDIPNHVPAMLIIGTSVTGESHFYIVL